MIETKRINAAAIAWIAVGGLAVLGALALFVHEIPAMRRELRLLRM